MLSRSPKSDKRLLSLMKLKVKFIVYMINYSSQVKEN